MNDDIIFALSSGAGKSGVAVVRISGDNLGDMFAQISHRNEYDARHAYFTNLTDTSGDLIDQAIVIYFAAPASFTGQDVIEIHCHGAPAVITKVFDHLRTLGGRMAMRGEFSRRAFYNNKMDLADIDGLAALLDAQTDNQRKSALKSMTGTDSKIYDTWRGQMIEIAGYAAAMLDYADDELPANIGDKLRSHTQKLYDEINTSLSRYAAVRTIRSGFNIVLAGETNVGKSSLFNRIVGANRAIVSDIPGTTRDVVSAQLDIAGFMVNLSDTAGIRDATDTIEKIGIAKTKSQIADADLVIRVYAENTDVNAAANELVVINKSDTIKNRNSTSAIYVSAKTGVGMDTLMSAIRERILKITDGTESSLAVNERTHGLLTDAATELKAALKLPQKNSDMFSEHVRRAADNIGKILGTITAADVMDATFSQLCLGK